MLEVRALEVRYPALKEPVLGGLSFDLEDGGLLALAGPSGCGKTTLLNVLSGVLTPTGGKITFDGMDLTPKSTAIGLIPQHYGLLPWKTVRQNLLFCAQARKHVNLTRLDALCTQLGLASLLNRFPRALSGGQAQRVALARALLMEPRLLLMDEPFAALDEAAALNARRLCFRAWRETGCTAIVVTHRLEEALFLADHIAVMAPGGHFSLLRENPCQGVEDCAHSGRAALLKELKAAVLDAAERAAEA